MKLQIGAERLTELVDGAVLTFIYFYFLIQRFYSEWMFLSSTAVQQVLEMLHGFIS